MGWGQNKGQRVAGDSFNRDGGDKGRRWFGIYL